MNDYDIFNFWFVSFCSCARSNTPSPCSTYNFHVQKTDNCCQCLLASALRHSPQNLRDTLTYIAMYVPYTCVIGCDINVFLIVFGDVPAPCDCKLFYPLCILVAEKPGETLSLSPLTLVPKSKCLRCLMPCLTCIEQSVGGHVSTLGWHTPHCVLRVVL